MSAKRTQQAQPAPEPETAMPRDETGAEQDVADPEPELEPQVDDSYIPPISTYASKPTVVAAIAARNIKPRKERALPKFLQPDRFRGRQTSSALRAVVLEQRYEDLAADLQESQERIDKQERDIELRRERSELEHRAKLERLRRRKEQNLEVLGTMAEEKRIRDKEAAYDHRMQRDPDPSRSIPQQIDPDAKALTQVKHELRNELDKLILQKKITKRIGEKDRLKQERFFLDNLHQELLDDHRHRRAVKSKTNKHLRAEWERQNEMSRISKSLRAAETM